MTSFEMYGKIVCVDDSDMVTDLSWIRTNYGADITKANAVGGAEPVIIFKIEKSSFLDITTVFTDMKAQFDDKLEGYGITMSEN